MTKSALTSNCTIPGILEIDESKEGMARAVITTKKCTAELYLQGAHLARWQPAGQEPVLFMSERSAIQVGKSIRGGIPIVYPWFATRTASATCPRTDGPKHGFVRTTNWQLDSATMNGDDLHLTLTLGANEVSRSLGYDNFQVSYKLIIGADLSLQFTVHNTGKDELCMEEALHTYFHVGDARQITIDGLANTEYLDKTDGFKRKRQSEETLSLSCETDRPYLNTTSTVILNDPVLKRKITVEKKNSKTTVIWNPWSELTAKLADMAPDGWTSMVCIETANAAENAVTIAPGAKHTLGTRISLASE